MTVLKTHIALIFSILFVLTTYAQNSTKKGYKIEGETVVFIFNVNDYPNINNIIDPINDVFVSGEFNNWARDQWKMNRVNDSIYHLKKDLSAFSSEFGWEFKFIVNSIHWAEPSDEFSNIVDARDWGGLPLMTYNLKLYSAFATEYGNVRFRLNGHKDAEKVILSGTFNRWDESGFKMKRTEDGWEVTLQLQPDVYQYKFIVDGNWIEDPQNPSKVKNEYNGYNSVIDIQKNVEFRLCDYPNAKSVILSGDFNNWALEELKMEKIDDCWTYTKRLSSGKHHYKFIVDGTWITDPANKIKEYDGKGNINSVCMVK
ncbi:glycogen-binding domain-containing protein [Winogradskyella ursingii]|uniref:glycogen-binding domain-containing protein n=1 Tax=Winogradskyella ursingii TaxID=2686079 RepID=UPI0015CA8EEA|nr:glycogen-binding domain-containing protein [Winogradskyella ursingii]